MLLNEVVGLGPWHLDLDALLHRLRKKVYLLYNQSEGSLPDAMEVAIKEKSFKRAAKAALHKTVKKQTEGGVRREKRNSRNSRR